jgi:alkylation response protein AidB-like acyl-CoA dehydrogenase
MADGHSAVATATDGEDFARSCAAVTLAHRHRPDGELLAALSDAGVLDPVRLLPVGGDRMAAAFLAGMLIETLGQRRAATVLLAGVPARLRPGVPADPDPDGGPATAATSATGPLYEVVGDPLGDVAAEPDAAVTDMVADWLLLAVCTLAADIAARALADTTAWAAQRIRFGRRLLDHQAVRHTLAGASARVTAARALFGEACREPAGSLRTAYPAVLHAAVAVTASCQRLWGARGFDPRHPVAYSVPDLGYLAGLARRAAGTASPAGRWRPIRDCAALDPDLADRYRTALRRCTGSVAGVAVPDPHRLADAMHNAAPGADSPTYSVADAVFAESLARDLAPGPAAAMVTQRLIVRDFLAAHLAPGHPLTAAVTRGELLGAFAVTEPESGVDLAAMTTRATRRDGTWWLSGSKVFVTGAADADLLVVAAVTSVGQLGLFIVDSRAAGVEVVRRPLLAWAGTGFADITFDEATARVVLCERDGMSTLARALARERLMVAVQLTTYARRWLRECPEVGSPATVAQIELAEAANRAAARAGPGHGALASAAKLLASRCSETVARQTVLAGAPRCAGSARPGWHLTEALAGATAGGPVEIQKEIIAATLEHATGVA